MADTLPDIVAEGLDVLFCGINPGLSAAASGLHFVNRSNRFWRVLHLSGFTAEEISPERGGDVLRYGCGLTTVVARPTAAAHELSRAEILTEADAFRHRVVRLAPRYVAFLGKMAYAALSGPSEVTWGRQPEPIGTSHVWVLPNPSGRNRAFSLDALVRAYRQLQDELHEAGATPDGGSGRTG
ncbi:MAG: G/U mismatch-specific DNA glycosylase [Luteibacter sp.]|uniref:G/U mismatch-specific DNA glycosylase n=1 Tax=Luteibacter sp. TaxID=1886636 RepID=UPI001383F67C|nr:G/U mismatch-specific DNA glycosylase [Luteibacter sp.]KAF1005616.1 MAG: G/U mismatch-specific DNA glycosylase [Luteibacter sp.]